MPLFTALFVLALASGAASAADARLLALLPPDASLLAGMQLDRAKTSPFGQFLLTQAAAGPELDRLRAATGFDPRTDLNELVLAGTPDGQALSAARGAFQPVLLADLARSAGLLVAPYRGFTLIGQEAVVAFLDGTTLLAGPGAQVKAGIDRWISGAQAAPAWTAQVAALSAGSEAWAVLNSVPAMAASSPKPLPPALQNVLSRIDRVSGALSLGATVTVQGAAQTYSTQDAEALAAVFQLLAALVGSQVPGVPAPQATVAGSTVNFILAVPEQTLEQLLRPRLNLRAGR